MAKPVLTILSLCIALSTSRNAYAASHNAVCASFLVYLSSAEGKTAFGQYYISPEEAQREAFRVAQRIYSAQGSIEQLRASETPIYACSNGNSFLKKRRDAAVAKRLMGVADFFARQARTESRLELTPDDPGYWEFVDGFALKIKDSAEAQNFISKWMPALALIETFERMADYNTSSLLADRIPRWTTSLYGLYFLYQIIWQLGHGWETETISQTLGPLSMAGFLAVMNDNWIRGALATDRNFDRLMLDLVSPKKDDSAWWGYHGTNGELPLTTSHPAFKDEALQGDDADDEGEIQDHWHHALFPAVQVPPYVDKTILNRLIMQSRMESYPTGMRLLGRVLGRLLPNRPDLIPLHEIDKLKVDTFIERKEGEGEDPNSISSVTIWFRRNTVKRSILEWRRR